MDAFTGRWKLFKTENYREYLKSIGIEEEKISVAELIKPTISFIKDGDFVVVKKVSTIHTEEVWFRLGEEFFELTKDGRECMNTVTLNGNKLVHVQRWAGKESTIVYEIQGENMVMKMTFGSILSTHYFKKVQ